MTRFLCRSQAPPRPLPVYTSTDLPKTRKKKHKLITLLNLLKLSDRRDAYQS